MTTTQTRTFLQTGKAVIEEEIRAIQALSARIAHPFSEVCELLLRCQGRVVVMGVGKSGHIGHKISATLASTGTPSFFVHPTEASHGDLGMITSEDVIIAISHSGQTQEILQLLPVLKRQNIPIVAMTGHLQSTLAEQATFTLDISVAKEACPLGLAPTNSTTVTLVLGDALAIALLEARGFTREDFAASHPGGMLGKRLLVRVEDVMQTGDRIPKVPPTAYIRQTLSEISRTQLGICAVVDAQNYLLGVFSDGDLRRALDKELNVHTTPVSEVMTVGGITMKANQLAAEALHWMDHKHIHAMMVINDHHQVVGAFNIHNLLARGVL